MLCDGPGPITLPAESVDHRGPGTLPESSRLPVDAITSLQGWSPCICKSEVLLNHPTFEETSGKESRIFQDNRHSRDALHHNPPPTTILRGSPCVPCLPT